MTEKKTSSKKSCDNIPLSIPENKTERNKMLEMVKSYVSEKHITPPPSKEELWKHAETLIQETGLSKRYYDLFKVLINNEIWKETIASVPYERRLLLIPQCLRSSKKCRAEIDEFGLLCEQCGACPICDIQNEAEALGYIVLVAEGTTVVTKLLESGKVDAIIGVSCLAVLEKTFPHMATHAIPGIAIPLFYDGCVDTKVDLEWLGEVIRLKSDETWFGSIELEQLHEEVTTWFNTDSLKQLMCGNSTTTRELAISWLGGNGKRWRPFLSTIVFKSLNGLETPLPLSIKKVALAVECFHKASLIHDDIEDEDDFRYGEATLHCKHGVAVALNIGDLLIGEGYRLIADSGVGAEQIVNMLTSAANGHHTLCIGQGEELICLKEAEPPSSSKILEIFRCKTSPAFEVSLSLGAFCADADTEICTILNKFSESLGIAYQIQDDIDDFHSALENKNTETLHSSILLAMAFEYADAKTSQKIISSWRKQKKGTEILNIIKGLNVEEKAKQLVEYHKNEAIRTLTPLKSAPLKSLLRKVIGRIVRPQTGSHPKKSHIQTGTDWVPDLRDTK